MSQIGDNVKYIREMRKLTQQQMADKLGVKRSTYNNWEGGTEPDLTTIQSIAAILQVDYTELITGRHAELKTLPEGNWSKAEKTLPVQSKDPLVQAILNLTESNRILAESNQVLANNNKELVLLMKPSSAGTGEAFQSSEVETLVQTDPVEHKPEFLDTKENDLITKKSQKRGNAAGKNK